MIYVISTNANGDVSYRSYEGMTQDVVTGLLAGDTIQFVTEEEWQAALPQRS
jgi:hypothetical protein